MKKIMALFLCAVLVFALSSCKKEKDNGNKGSAVGGKAEKDVSITLLYSKTDNFNPYTAKTAENRDLCSLLFDPLINLKSDCTAEYCIASSAEVTGQNSTVHLKNVYFTDGTPLTAQDVVYSFELAKSSVSSGFASSLSSVVSATPVDSLTVQFTSSYHDPYILNLLTFPILKQNSAGLTDSDGVELVPTGSGKFILKNGENFMTRNDKYFGKHGNIKKINLLAAPDSESVSHYVEVGASDLYYTDVSEGKIVRMSGKRKEVNLNRLVYIGVNSASAGLSSKQMRYALSSAIDRSEILDSAYYGIGTPASSYYNPALAEVKSTASLEEKANIQITVENLSELGYNEKDDFGYYINQSGKRLSFSLLVNNDNVSRLSAARLIVAECKSAGIEIILDEHDYNTYLSKLKSNSFELYLGEIQILPNFDMGQLASLGGSAAYGVNETPTGNNQLTVSQAITSFKSGGIGISDLSGVLLTEMPQIPVLYRNGLLFYSDKIKSGVEGLYKNIYYSIEKYKF